MTITPASPGGRQIWKLLPEHYRTRDNGDLARYIDALGEVLDLLRGVIQQRVADTFPNHPDVQPWVLPYLADLVDPRAVSADEATRRAELVHAAHWRKTKGTLRMVEQIAAVLGGFAWTTADPAARPRELVQVQEGWRRVAVTPRVPLDTPPEVRHDRRALLAHGSLPMGTVDLRSYSRWVAAAAGGASSQANPHGVPCFPGTVEDLSARTPDLRTPTWRSGHAHPNRVLIYTVPHAGFFPPGWKQAPRPTGDGRSMRGGVLSGTQEIEVAADEVFTIEDCIVDGTLHVKRGGIRLVRCAVRNLVVDPQVVLGEGGRPSTGPVLMAADCLFETVQSAGLAQLTFCTVLGSFKAPRVWTSDSLFASAFDVPRPAEPWHKTPQGEYDGTPESAIRYSRIPPDALATAPGPEDMRLDFKTYRSTDAPPHFLASAFGAPGSGVLLPLSGPAIEAGAEDGGELGAYHHRGHAVRARAVLEKLRGYLPIGQVAVVIPDERLTHSPPILKSHT